MAAHILLLPRAMSRLVCAGLSGVGGGGGAWARWKLFRVCFLLGGVSGLLFRRNSCPAFPWDPPFLCSPARKECVRSRSRCVSWKPGQLKLNILKTLRSSAFSVFLSVVLRFSKLSVVFICRRLQGRRLLRGLGSTGLYTSWAPDLTSDLEVSQGWPPANLWLHGSWWRTRTPCLTCRRRRGLS